MQAWIIYALWRALLFAAPFIVLTIAGVEWYVALVIALVFAFCASYIFLRGPRERAALELQRMREGRAATGDDDDDVEDALFDARDDGAGAWATEPRSVLEADRAESVEPAPQRDGDAHPERER